MHLLRTISLLALVALGTSAVQEPQKQVLISFPQDTPQSDLTNYKTAITSAGGEILHEWATIKGFIVKASTDALAAIEAFSKEQKGAKATIEEDGTVTTQV